MIPPGFFRFFLAALVVIHHSFPLRLGAWSVAIFFVLSGYWIARIWDEKYSQLDHPYIKFVISRWWRLAPLFVTVQLTGYLYSVIRSEVTYGEVDLPIGWWITQPLVLGSTQFSRPLPPSWSLDVEMQFYFLAPVLLIGLNGNLGGATKQMFHGPGMRDLGPSIGSRGWDGMIILSLLLGWSLLLTASGVQAESPRFDLYAWLFVIGVVTYLNRWIPSLRSQWLSLASLIALVSVTLLIPSTRELVWRTGSSTASIWPWKISLFAFVLALLGIPLAISTVFRKSSAWDRWLGDLSYPLYLFHWIPREWYYSQVDWNLPASRNILLLLANFAIAVVGAVALLHLVDRPCQHFRSRWFIRTCDTAESNKRA